MKRFILTFICLLLSFWLRAQLPYTCRYWFDQNIGQAVTTPLGEGTWQAELDVDVLEMGLHYVHFQVADTSMRWSSPQGFPFIKTANVQPENMPYYYWFDQDHDQMHEGQVGNGIVPLDVNALKTGLHSLHVMMGIDVLTSTKSYLFLKEPGQWSVSNIIYHCWFDQDFEHSVTNALGNGSLLLDVNSLTDGMHTVHVMLEDNTYTSTQSYLFLKDSSIQGTSDLTCHWWFDTDLEHKVTSSLADGNLLLDVSSLAEGVHSVHVMLGDGTYTATQSYLFVKTAVTPEEGVQYQCWFDSDISSLQTGPVGSGIFFIDVTSLPIGEHEMVMQLNDGVLFSPKYYAFYRDPVVLVSANPVEGGTATSQIIDTICTLTATPNVGYHFVNWTMNGEEVSTESVYSFTATEDVAYVANFEINSYEILATVDPMNSGTVVGGGIYNHFATCTLTATPATGYHFVNWTLNGEEVSTNATYSFEVTHPAAYVANFEINSYEILATVDPMNSGTVVGGGIYNHFATCTLTATANDGYTFINWTKNGEEVSTNAVYSFTVTGNASFVAHFDLNQSEDIIQAISFASGWNWMSTYVEQNGINGLAMLEEGLDNAGVQIKSQSSYVMNYGGFWMGLLNGITNEQTYLVEANAPVDIELIGLAAQPSEHPITLTNGWNWIGYPNSSSMSLSEACSDFTPANGDELKTQNGFSQYYSGFGWMGTLSTLTPGMGLMYKSNNQESVTFMYPEAIRNSELIENVTNEDNHWTNDVHAYPTNMTMTAVVELDDEELASENYELAAFANGEVRGSAKLMYVEPLHRYMAFMTIAGNEATDLHFGLYNTTTGEEILETKDQLTYTSDAIVGNPETPKVIRFRSTESLSDLQRSLQVYPNPVARGENFSLSLPENAKARVEIVNALGTILSSETTTKTAASIKAPATAGVYTLRITVEGTGTCTRKLVVK